MHGRFHIVAFDVGTENFRTIPTPDQLRPNYGETGLMEVEGQLSIVYARKTGKSYNMEIWSFFQNGMGWEKRGMIRIPLEEESESLLHFTTNNAGDIVVLTWLDLVKPVRFKSLL